MRAIAWLLFLLFAVLVASNGRGLWDDTPLQLPVSASLATAGLLCALCLETIRLRRAGRGLVRLHLEGAVSPLSHAESALRIARSGAWIIGALCLFLVASAFIATIHTPPLSQELAVPFGVVALAVEVTLRRKIGGDGFGWRLAARSAGVLALAWSFTVIILALCVWPLRVELNRQLEHRLSMSETDWMREQLQKFPPPHS